MDRAASDERIRFKQERMCPQHTPSCTLARLGAALTLGLHLRDPEAGLSVLVVRLELEHLDWGQGLGLGLGLGLGQGS